jgi:hypothetical protein
MRIRVSLVVLGIAMMLFGVISALIGPHFNAMRHSLFLAAALVVHDGVLLPFFLLVGALVARFVPARSRALVQGALIVTAAVTVIALPFMLGYGRRADIPSALPRNYIGGYALVVGVVWVIATLLLIIRRRTHRGR